MSEVSMRVVMCLTLFLCLFQCYANPQTMCSNTVIDSEISSCFKSAKLAAEKTLNEEYLAAKKRIDAEYSASSADLQFYMLTLTESQRGWLKYRDGQCHLESFMAEKGTVAHDTLTDKCIARIDLERVEQLKTLPYE